MTTARRRARAHRALVVFLARAVMAACWVTVVAAFFAGLFFLLTGGLDHALHVWTAMGLCAGAGSRLPYLLARHVAVLDARIASLAPYPCQRGCGACFSGPEARAYHHTMAH